MKKRKRRKKNIKKSWAALFHWIFWPENQKSCLSPPSHELKMLEKRVREKKNADKLKKNTCSETKYHK